MYHVTHLSDAKTMRRHLTLPLDTDREVKRLIGTVENDLVHDDAVEAPSDLLTSYGAADPELALTAAAEPGVGVTAVT